MERDVTIRPERPEDADSIHAVVASAFGKPDEAVLVRRIRASDRYVPGFALVAEDGRGIAGHVMLSYVDLVDETTTHRILSLAPLAVRPDAQRGGIGGALVRAAVDSADAAREPLVVLEGSPAYYPRFGFRYCEPLGIHIELPEWAPREAAMVRPLTAYRPEIRGTVVYPPAFESLGDI